MSASIGVKAGRGGTVGGIRLRDGARRREVPAVVGQREVPHCRFFLPYEYGRITGSAVTKGSGRSAWAPDTVSTGSPFLIQYSIPPIISFTE